MKNDSRENRAENTTGSNPAFNLIGIKVNPISHDQILEQMGEWIRIRSMGHSVVVANAHVVVENRQNPDFKNAVSSASLVIPDGMPVVVASRWRGFTLKSRSDGPGLMHKALSEEPFNKWHHYLYGGTSKVISELRNHYPNAQICSAYAPPFRPLTSEEDKAVIDDINHSGADVLWVGLGCPKQEIWMHEHYKSLEVPVLLGVGQAFDILAGVKPRAPHWMQNIGLEWLYRLISEPKRLWKRYLVNNSLFLFYFVREQIGIFLRK